MSNATVGKWGKNLAVRVPMEVARIAGLIDGEKVEVIEQDGDLIIRRHAAHAQALCGAEAAAAEIIGESRLHTLGGLTIRELLEDGRRG